ncbi:RNA polymerase sigma factor sigma-70 region 4 domain-containing protein [Aeromonas hydrophila]|uniref:hypothetical protein n=1 Tax=Aeromonas hydrophila TaxID=644 RepID=UPI00190F94D3|nr:hypothetical protein [Aeromonas hydrophila]
MRLTNEQREQVLELRRRHSLSEVADIAGLPLGTVKAIISRSGLFADNPRHRAMFTLPPRQSSRETLPAAPELPPQQEVTGDKEIDALLWLRQVIETGDPGRIEQAKEAACRIATPLDELETRSGKWLVASAGHIIAGLGSIGFANLDGLAECAIERRAKEAEAVGRVGDELWNDTPAEVFCLESLRTVERVKWDYPPEQVADRFKALPELMPHTLSDCLHELAYWDDLYRLRRACDTSGNYENRMESSARDGFIFGLLAKLRPRTREEAKGTLRYLMASERNDMPKADQILENLIS